MHTGQHFDDNMSQFFFEELGIAKPRINLGINRLGHTAMTARMLEALAITMSNMQPDCVLVYGDSTTTLAAALVAKQSGIPLIHVEAGLRNYRLNMPEELNRTITDRISDFLFCPTQNAVQHLRDEGFDKFGAKILFSGDVMFDAALHFSHKADIYGGLFGRYPNLTSGEYILCTFHREENTENLKKVVQICDAINLLSSKYQIVIPLHPRTHKIIQSLGIKLKTDVLPPQGYLDMNLLIRNARLVLTDSGGLQKEAYFFKKYCILLRLETEWEELVEGGFTLIAGTEVQTIFDSVTRYFDIPFKNKMNIFGDGHAAEIIVSHLLKNQDSLQVSPQR